MRFKIKSTKITISFSFLLFFLICALNDSLGLYIKSLSVSLIHETVHIIFILYFNDEVSAITFNVFGGKIEKANKKFLSNIKEAFINLSAPVFNIFLGVISFLINNKSQWAYVNIFIGIFNLLPFYSFDGGRALFFLLCNKFDFKTAESIVYFVSLAVCLVFMIFSIVLYRCYIKNYILLIMSFYMIFSLFLFKKL